MIPLPWDGRWHAWRLDREIYKDTWDSGIGAQRTGGRWNPPGRRVIYASADPSTAILEVASHLGFDALDMMPYLLTCFEVLDPALVKVVQVEDLPNPNWLIPARPSPNQQQFADKLLAEYPFILIPSAVTQHSWNLLVSCDLATNQFRLVSQERFGLDTRLVK
ncbi:MULTISPECIES: RES family NAD+ phosphorylase [Pseudomonas]|uniref:RES family NAD+ phosphorylase n=1 Tax=Pseudomonas TaxID=286 RepID=UPI00069E5809|nr:MULTISPECIES: RES family NAD+ phosphorylase [Pseudomonas]MCE0463988.1 RES family NAD+ phosphorylase [Pseudomonas uvaldensis]